MSGGTHEHRDKGEVVEMKETNITRDRIALLWKGLKPINE